VVGLQAKQELARLVWWNEFNIFMHLVYIA